MSQASRPFRAQRNGRCGYCLSWIVKEHTRNGTTGEIQAGSTIRKLPAPGIHRGSRTFYYVHDECFTRCGGLRYMEDKNGGL